MDSPVEERCSSLHPRHLHHQCHPHRHHHHHPHRHHHHHHFHVSPHCALHNYLIPSNNHSPACPLFVQHLPSQIPLPGALNWMPSEPEKAVPNSLIMQEENVELEQEEEEEDDDDPVFVLTDEWREFFAKSEAKRRLEKKQAKKKGTKK